MTPRYRAAALALTVSLLGCSSTEATGVGGGGRSGAGGSGAGGADACSIADYCSPESCRTAADELAELESLRERGVRHANRKFGFCDGTLAWSSYWECDFECGQCDTWDRYYDASGLLVGYRFCTDTDDDLPCTAEYCTTYGDADPACDGVWTTEGPCFGVPCTECSDGSGDVCNDGNPCTEDYCCFEVCKNTAEPDETPCEGGTCMDGVCTPDP